MKAGRWIVAIIGVAAGLSFATVAALSLGVLAVTAGHFRASSVVFAVISLWLAYRSLHAATRSRSDEESVVRGLQAGIAGALVGLLIVFAGFAMFAQSIRAYFAHPVGLHFSDVTMFRLLVALVWLGFGAGFALRIPKLQ